MSRVQSFNARVQEELAHRAKKYIVEIFGAYAIGYDGKRYRIVMWMNNHEAQKAGRTNKGILTSAEKRAQRREEQYEEKQRRKKERETLKPL